MKTLPAEQLASFLHEAKESGVFELYYIELATGLRMGSYKIDRIIDLCSRLDELENLNELVELLA